MGQVDLLAGLTGGHTVTADEPSERELGEAILDELEAERLRQDFLARLRTEMVDLYQERELAAPGHGYVCADDARKLLESWPDVPPPEQLSRNFMGALFRGSEWIASGMVESATKGSHGRRIVSWRLRDAGA